MSEIDPTGTDITTPGPMVAADLDGNGIDDVQVELLTDGSYHIQVDVDGDQLSDTEAVVDREQLDQLLPGASEALDGQLAPVDPLPADGLAGDPFGDAEHWFQQSLNGFCAPASVAQIVSEYSGVHFPDESAFVQLASDQGLFSVGMDGVPGMTPDNTLALLEASGVPAGLEFGTTGDLVQYLEEGRSILLFIDSGEVWTGESVEDNVYDHAVVLTGIDTERGVAILSDPGSPDGNLEEVPLDVFTDAWADSQNAMIVCDEPAPGDLPPGDSALGEPGPVAGEPVAGEPVGAGEREPGPIERATAAVLTGPWALLPVTLPAIA